MQFNSLIAQIIVRRGIVIIFSISLTLLICYILNRTTSKRVFNSTSACNIGLAVSAAILALLALLDDFSSYIRLIFWKSTLVKFVIIIFACDLAYDCSQIKDDLNQKELELQKKQTDISNLKRDKSFNDSLRLRDKSFNDSLKVRTKEITRDFVSALIQNGKT